MSIARLQLGHNSLSLHAGAEVVAIRRCGKVEACRTEKRRHGESLREVPPVVERADGEEQVAVDVVELDARADAAVRKLASHAGAQVHAALARRDARERRDVGFDVHAVQPEVEENVGAGVRRRQNRGGRSRDARRIVCCSWIARH